MRPVKRQRFRYDVFISYSHRNKDWVRGWLVPRLKNAGVTVCIDHESFEPGAPSISEMERAVLQSRKTVLVLTPEYLQSGWTEFENILVQTLDPAAHQRRLIPVLLLRCELPLRVGILTYIDFTLAAEYDQRAEQLIAAIRLRPAPGRRPKVVTAVSLPFEIPTGALSPDSPIYIERSHDQGIRQQVTRQGSTTFIEGARLMGKSSLVARALAYARSQQSTIVGFDFQSFDEAYLDNLETLLRYLADAIYEQLRLARSPDDVWQGSRGAKIKLTSFIQNYVLQGAQTTVVMVMDEVDRVLGRPYQDDFFSLLRAWHNIRARNPLWTKLSLVLACSTDPRQSIKDPRQSPFNVGTKIQLGDFSFDEMWELNRRYGRPLKRKDHLESLMEVISGHPYLGQQAFYALAAHTHTLLSIRDAGNADLGPFADHLQHYRNRLASEPRLWDGLRQVIRNGNCPNYEVFSRLRSLGLIAGISHDAVRPRCRLYEAYFQRVLS